MNTPFRFATLTDLFRVFPYSLLETCHCKFLTHTSLIIYADNHILTGCCIIFDLRKAF
jgi:hypothetical protein